jgi:hypothetical protein
MAREILDACNTNRRGVMGKRPAEFPTDWHYENHLENLAREIDGRKAVLATFEALPDDAEGKDEAVKRTKMELKAARDELAHYTKGPKTASKRPKAKAETR